MHQFDKWKPRVWYFLQALESCPSVRERQKVINMIVEEILDLQTQIVCWLELPLPEWDWPVLTAKNMKQAKAIGREVADRMDYLTRYVWDMTDDKDGNEVWPVRRYDKRKIWAEEYGDILNANEYSRRPLRDFPPLRVIASNGEIVDPSMTAGILEGA